MPALAPLDPNTRRLARLIESEGDQPPFAQKPRLRSRSRSPSPSPTPTPSIPTAAATPADIKRLVLADLKAAFAAISPGLVGPIDQGIKMPKASSDGRVLTWTKLAEELAEKVAVSGTTPTTTDDCWGVRPAPGNTSGYIIKKLTAKGEGNKQAVYRILFAVYSPQRWGGVLASEATTTAAKEAADAAKKTSAALSLHATTTAATAQALASAYDAALLSKLEIDHLCRRETKLEVLPGGASIPTTSPM